MAGENLRGVCMEVAFELWTERNWKVFSRLQRGSYVTGKMDRIFIHSCLSDELSDYCAGRVQERS